MAYPNILESNGVCRDIDSRYQRLMTLARDGRYGVWDTEAVQSRLFARWMSERSTMLARRYGF